MSDSDGFKVVFLRVPADLHEKISSAAAEYDTRRTRNITRMLVNLLEDTYGCSNDDETACIENVDEDASCQAAAG